MDLKRKIAKHWSRDGFVRKNSYLRREVPGVTQMIYLQRTSIGTLQVSVALCDHRLLPAGKEPTLDDAHISTALGAADGTNHLESTNTEFEFLESLSDADLAHWCAYRFDTAIYHFFSVFSSAAECARIVLGPRFEDLGIVTSPQYRALLGIQERRGRWIFVERSGLAGADGD